MNLDYTDLKDTFSDLAKLAAKVTGSPVSMVNLIDNYTVWTVSSYGFAVEQTPREESVCQYTILEKEEFVVNDMTLNSVFKDEGFVTGDPHFRFYHGVPLKHLGHNLGALCVLDRKDKALSAEKVELLKIIAGEVTNRLKAMQHIEQLRGKMHEIKDVQNRMAHDIRGPVAGIMAIAEVISQQGNENTLDEVLEVIRMIYKSGKSVLELADEILTEDKKALINAKSRTGMLNTLKERFEQLYTPQALGKNVTLKVELEDTDSDVNLSQPKLMQIAGNLISNAIKFTPRESSVTVSMNVLQVTENERKLRIAVKDEGAGISEEQIAQLLADNTESTDGTDGEKGYGFGLALVKHLVKALNGTFEIKSRPGEGSMFEVALPFSV